MKKLIVTISIILMVSLFSGCGAYVASPATGFLYTDVQAPLAVTSNEGSSKVGTGEIQSILGLVATGDASIQTAAESAGITKIHHVDYESKSILGIIGTFRVVVYGE